MWDELLRAFCLLLILEGVLPFLYPARWRELVNTLSQVNDRALRVIGLVSMLIGVASLYLLRNT